MFISEIIFFFQKKNFEYALTKYKNILKFSKFSSRVPKEIVQTDIDP